MSQTQAQAQEIQPGDVVVIGSEEVHVLKVDRGGVHGHTTAHCDDAGCSGHTYYFRFPEETETNSVGAQDVGA